MQWVCGRLVLEQQALPYFKQHKWGSCWQGSHRSQSGKIISCRGRDGFHAVSTSNHNYNKGGGGEGRKELTECVGNIAADVAKVGKFFLDWIIVLDKELHLLCRNKGSIRVLKQVNVSG